MQRLAALILVVAVVAFGCSDDDDDDRDATTTTKPTSTTTSTTEATTSTTAFDGATTPTSIPAETEGVALLTAVRVAGHPGFDRVVFEFRDATDRPGIDIRYVDRLQEDGSGDPVEAEGSVFLSVRMEPASGADLSKDPFEETYTGADRVRGDTKVVREVVRTGDFEANLTWGIGLRTRAPYRVTVLTDPVRVVIDVSAP